MKRKHKKLLRYIIYLLITLFFGYYVKEGIDVDHDLSIKCVDGDTFWLGEEKIRLLAIDTPEIQNDTTKSDPYGNEAADYTCSVLQNATTISLSQDKDNEVDKYGRSLYWVYTDDMLLQEKLLLEGLASIKYVDKNTIDPLIYSQLELAQKKAQLEEKGLWKQE